MINMAYGILGNEVYIGMENDLKEKHEGILFVDKEELGKKKAEIKKVEVDIIEDNFNSLFAGFEKIEEVNVSSNINLGEKMFCGCSGLQRVNMGDNCTLGKGTFENCKNLGSIICGHSGNGLKSIEDEAFKDAKLSSLDGEAVIDIGKSAFENCEMASQIGLYVPNLKSIGDSAFRGSKNMKIILNLKNLDFIGKEAFKDAEGLKIVTLGEININEIDKGFFENAPEWLEDVEFIEKLKPDGLDVSTMKKINRKNFRDMLRGIGFNDTIALHKVVNAIGNRQINNK